MSKEKTTENTLNSSEDTNSKVYELGFHFVPTLPEESVAVEFSNLKSQIEKINGTFISEDFPKSIVLAYSITKKLKTVNHEYDRAYFGWVKFEAEAESIENLKKQLDLSDIVLRYLIIKTVKENTLYGNKVVQSHGKGIVRKSKTDADSEESTDAAVVTEAVETTETVDAVPETSPMTEAEIDKTIEDLVIN